jgi:hypothetical protein
VDGPTTRAEFISRKGFALQIRNAAAVGRTEISEPKLWQIVENPGVGNPGAGYPGVGYPDVGNSGVEWFFDHRTFENLVSAPVWPDITGLAFKDFRPKPTPLNTTAAVPVVASSSDGVPTTTARDISSRSLQ